MRKIYCLLLIIFVAIITLSGCVFPVTGFKFSLYKSYDQAKKSTVDFFTKNQAELESAANAILDDKSANEISVVGITSISYNKVETSEKVTFDFDAQGMLGGQYWGIYYSSDNIPRIDSSILDLTEATLENCYFYKQTDGNNYHFSERIAPNWFFYYEDYDGSYLSPDWEVKPVL